MIAVLALMAAMADPWYLDYVENRMDRWEARVVAGERRGVQVPSEALYAQLEAEYGFIGWALGQKRTDVARERLAWTEGAWKELWAREPASARVWALRSALDGYQMALAPWTAPFKGPGSMEAARKAVAADPKDPRAWVELGHVDYYAPELLGGNPRNALAAWDRALALWDAAGEGSGGNWRYLQTLGDAARVRVRLGDTAGAAAVWARAVAQEPRLSAWPMPRP